MNEFPVSEVDIILGNPFLSMSSNSPLFFTGLKDRMAAFEGGNGSARAALLEFPIKWNQTRSGRNERRDSCTRGSP